jgi:hypothetical protein
LVIVEVVKAVLIVEAVTAKRGFRALVAALGGSNQH